MYLRQTSMFLFALALLAAGAHAGVMYPNFNSTSGLQLNGQVSTATVGSSDVIRFAGTNDQEGSVFTTTKMPVGGFSTFFEFEVIEQNAGDDAADGFVFVIQNDSRGDEALGQGGGNNGYGDINGSSDIINSVAVEFDFQNNGPFNDPNDSHVAIFTGGAAEHGTSGDQGSSAVSSMVGDDMAGNGDSRFAWVDYDGTTLSIYLASSTSKPGTATLTAALDLPNAIIGSDEAHYGFTASVGKNGQTFDTDVDLRQWTLTTIPEPATALTSMLMLSVMAIARRR